MREFFFRLFSRVFAREVRASVEVLRLRRTYDVARCGRAAYEELVAGVGGDGDEARDFRARIAYEVGLLLYHVDGRDAVVTAFPETSGAWGIATGGRVIAPDEQRIS